MELSPIFQSLGFKNVELTILSLIALIIFLLFVGGYQYRIIKSSLNDVAVPPEFNAWRDMFVDGIRVTMVVIGYLLPGIFIIGFIAGIFIASGANQFTQIFIAIAILYIIIFIPIYLMAIAYMADNGSKLGTAFRFHEILNKISLKGRVNFIIWYILTGIIFLVILIIGSSLTNDIGRLTFPTIGIILLSLVVNPYLSMYINRSVALFYISK
jgi:hypothetical protein